MVSMMEAMLIISMLAFLSYAAVCIVIVYKNRRAPKNAIIKATLVFTLTLITTVFIYYAIWFFEELSYFIVYEFVKRPGLTVDFSINKGLYYGYMLPYALFFANLMLVLVKNKKANLIAVILIYLIFILWGWGWHTLSYWPYRAMPMLCVLSVFYLLDVLIVRFIVKKLLQRTAV